MQEKNLANIPADCQGEAPVCPDEAVMRLLERKWTLHLLHALASGRKRFCQVQEAMGSVNSVTLARRLRDLEAHGIVRREVLRPIPPWVEYELTPKGRDLVAILRALDEWSQKWGVGQAPAPARRRRNREPLAS